MGDDDQQDFNDLDFSGFEVPNFESESQDPSPDEGQQENQEESKFEGNPAWKPYLEKVPEGLHNLVRPAFEDWDKGVQKRFQDLSEQWAPFKKFRENNVDPEYLDRAYQVAQQLQQDPVAIYRSLHEYFQQNTSYHPQLIQAGLMPDPNAQQEQQKPDGEQEPLDPVKEIEELREQFKAQQQQTLEMLQRQQEEQQYNQIYQDTVQAIENEFTQLEEKVKGTIPPAVRAEIIKQAQFMGQQAGKSVSVLEAAPHVFRFMAQARAGVKSAPNHIGSGGIPQAANFDPTTATAEERAEQIRAIRDRIAGGN